MLRVEGIGFGDKTRMESHRLNVNREELKRIILGDERLRSVDLELALPGDSTRLMPVKDVIEPRCKIGGGGEVFPGLVGGVQTVGKGSTLVLRGCAVVTVGRVVGFQEGIIDMSGPGADFTPFSRTCNLVLSAKPREGLERHEHETALRLAGCRAAEYLARSVKDTAPDLIESYEAPSSGMGSGLPRVAYLYLLQSQGLLHDTYLYGVDVKRMLPTYLFPTEVMDGAIVSGNCVSACDKNTTYHHQNNPVIEELFRLHGQELEFAGVVCSNENVTLLEKERSSWYASKLVGQLGVQGVIISKEGFGNPDTDMVMNFRRLNEMGIKTVVITDEFPGADGASPSLADADPLIDAVVSTGNANQVVELPAMKRVISDLKMVETLAGGWAGSVYSGGSIKVELQVITGATNEMGYNRMGAWGF